MIKELTQILPQVPDLLLDKESWGSLLIDKYPPVIHRMSYKLSETRTLILHRLFHCKSEKAYMHSHSWPFALKIIQGGYEMGIGFSSNRNVSPAALATVYLKEGNTYEMTSSDIWHYTKPVEHAESWSIMLIGPRWRERKASNNLPLNEFQKDEMFNFFKKNI